MTYSRQLRQKRMIAEHVSRQHYPYVCVRCLRLFTHEVECRGDSLPTGHEPTMTVPRGPSTLDRMRGRQLSS